MPYTGRFAILRRDFAFGNIMSATYFRFDRFQCRSMPLLSGDIYFNTIPICDVQLIISSPVTEEIVAFYGENNH
jgi:hypothetical protein